MKYLHSFFMFKYIYTAYIHKNTNIHVPMELLELLGYEKWVIKYIRV